ncbi:hypothetical protein V8E53_004597 [Lactarius tabidus]
MLNDDSLTAPGPRASSWQSGIEVERKGPSINVFPDELVDMENSPKEHENGTLEVAQCLTHARAWNLPQENKNVRTLEAPQCGAELRRTRAPCAVEAKQDDSVPGSGALDLIESCLYARTGRSLLYLQPVKLKEKYMTGRENKQKTYTVPVVVNISVLLSSPNRVHLLPSLSSPPSHRMDALFALLASRPELATARTRSKYYPDLKNMHRLSETSHSRCVSPLSILFLAKEEAATAEGSNANANTSTLHFHPHHRPTEAVDYRVLTLEVAQCLTHARILLGMFLASALAPRTWSGSGVAPIRNSSYIC